MPERRKSKLFYRVMLIDDDPDIRVLMDTIMNKSWAFKVYWSFSSAQDAIDYLKGGHRYDTGIQVDPEVILLDFLMPKMSGKDAFPVLRALVPKAKILITTVVPERCDEVPGNDGCVDKSLLPSDMVYSLYRVLHPDTTLKKEDM